MILPIFRPVSTCHANDNLLHILRVIFFDFVMADPQILAKELTTLDTINLSDFLSIFYDNNTTETPVVSEVREKIDILISLEI